MAKLIWTDPALDDLSDIADYIAIHNHTAAQKLVQLIFHRVEQLEQFPKSGKRPTEIEGDLYRELVVPPCRIFYRIDGRVVYIIHVMRGERLFSERRLKQHDEPLPTDSTD